MGIWISKFWGSSGISCRQHAHSSSETCRSTAQGFPGYGIHGTIAMRTDGSQPSPEPSCRMCPSFPNFLADDWLNLPGVFNGIGMPSPLFWPWGLLTPSIRWSSLSYFILGHHLPGLWRAQSVVELHHSEEAVATSLSCPGNTMAETKRISASVPSSGASTVEQCMCWALVLPAPAISLPLLALEGGWGEPPHCPALHLHPHEAHGISLKSGRTRSLSSGQNWDRVTRTLPKPSDVRWGLQGAAKKLSSWFAIALCFCGTYTAADKAGELHSAYSVMGVSSHASCKAVVV